MQELALCYLNFVYNYGVKAKVFFIVIILIFLIIFTELYILRGTLTISSTPSAAKVYVNEDFRGETPLEIKLHSGKYEIKILKDGFEVYTTTVNIRANKRLSISPYLEKLQYILALRENGFYKVSSDGRIITQLGENFDGNVGCVSFSPDGKKILYILHSSDYKESSLCIMDTDGKNRKILINDITLDVYPIFFHNNKKILFGSLNSKGNFFTLWTININGSEKRKIAEVEEHEEIKCAISPDDSKILFYGLDREQRRRSTGLWIVDSTGKNLINIMKGRVIAASFSPDGNKIAFAFPYKIWVTDLYGKNIKKIGEGTIDENGLSSIKFSNDGKRAFFVSNGCLNSAYIDGSGEEIIRVGVSDFCLQNEGKILLLTSQPNFSLINIDGTGEREITGILGSPVYLDYIYIFGSPISPNGKKVLCSIGSNSDSYQYILDLDSGKLIKLDFGMCGWFPDNK